MGSKGKKRLRYCFDALRSKMFFETEENEWRKDTITATLNAGENKFYLFNTAGIDMMVDQVIFSPADEELEKFDITIKSSEHGSPMASVESAYEGQYVTISANPAEGYAFKGWNIIHGKIDLTDNGDGTFSFLMPDDIVTLEPIYVDNTIVYKMDLTTLKPPAELCYSDGRSYAYIERLACDGTCGVRRDIDLVCDN